MASSYVSEIKSIDKELKRLNETVKKLRAQKKVAQGHLYDYMVNNGLDKCEDVKIGSVKPKPVVKRKTEKQKRNDAIALFAESGIQNPEALYDTLKSLYKPTLVEE